jgi:hypothetical protein
LGLRFSLNFQLVFASKGEFWFSQKKIRRQLSRKSDLTRIGTVGPRCRPPILLQLSTTFSSKGEFGFSQKKSAASKLGKLV